MAAAAIYSNESNHLVMKQLVLLVVENDQRTDEFRSVPSKVVQGE